MSIARKSTKKILFYAASIAGLFFAMAVKENPTSEKEGLVVLGEKADKLFLKSDGLALTKVAKADIPASCIPSGDDGDDDDGDDGD